MKNTFELFAIKVLDAAGLPNTLVDREDRESELNFVTRIVALFNGLSVEQKVSVYNEFGFRIEESEVYGGLCRHFCYEDITVGRLTFVCSYEFSGSFYVSVDSLLSNYDEEKDFDLVCEFDEV